MNAAPRYRPSVAAIVQDSEGRVLLGERLDTPDGWQFPQGGVHRGETHQNALARELMEEVGLTPAAYTVRRTEGPYRYLFPVHRTKDKFNGQEQHYFLLLLNEAAAKLDFRTATPEFRAIKWIAPAEFRLEWLPEMKHEVYRRVFVDFFGVKLA